MARPKDPRFYRSPLLPTPINIRPAYNSNNLTFDSRARYQNFNNHPNYNFNFHSESIDPKSEIHPNFIDVNLDILPGSIDNDSNICPEPMDPKLDFCSDSFDPHFFLNQPYDIVKNALPYPKAKEYNNLAEYYSHHFLKKDNFKKAEKDRLYDRNYAWYYKVLGWDNKIQQRYEQRILRRTRKYAGWLTAKLRKYKPRFRNDDPNYEPCRGFAPLQSTKIIQTQSKFRKYKIFPKSSVTDTSDLPTSDLPASDLPTRDLPASDLPEMKLADEDTLIPITKEAD